mmetsp:Transcript_51189/g.112133  ORF Transcript_51189/g.112133 Transcript_51189/m.112133 type:complete len:621 (-) Transcript_51189:74-1936(-)
MAARKRASEAECQPLDDMGGMDTSSMSWLGLGAHLAGRVAELTWLYAPLLPLLASAVAADTIEEHAPRMPLGWVVANRLKNVGSNWRVSKDWREAWWELTLSRVQQSGPVFVKLGQWAATRPDLFSEEWACALSRLHDNTEPHSLDHTHRIMSKAFDAMAKKIGESNGHRNADWSRHLLIEPKPVGSGCMAQVHAGLLVLPEDIEQHGQAEGQPKRSLLSRLPLPRLRWPFAGRSGSGAGALPESVKARKVAVKIVHPRVRRCMELDLKVLKAFAEVTDVLGFESLGASLAMRQFATFLNSQADLRVEAGNLRTLRAQLAGTGVIVPQVYDPWVSPDALVMSFEEGQPLSVLMSRHEGPAEQEDGFVECADDCGDAVKREAAAARDMLELARHRQEAWRQLVDSFWAMVFRTRLVHGDLHPGNILWRCRGENDQGRLVLLDCGLAVDLRGEAGKDLSKVMKALLTKDEAEVGRMLMELALRVGGRMEDVVDPEGFAESIGDLIREAKKTSFRLSKLNAGALMGRSLLLGRRHRVRFDVRFVNLMVAMAIVQGVSLRLHAEGDFMARMRPFLFGAAIAGIAGRGAGEGQSPGDAGQEDPNEEESPDDLSQSESEYSTPLSY